MTFGAIDADVGDLARVGVIQNLGDADGFFLAGAGGLCDVLPEDEETGEKRDPEKHLFDCRVQADFLVLTAGTTEAEVLRCP